MNTSTEQNVTKKFMSAVDAIKTLDGMSDEARVAIDMYAGAITSFVTLLGIERDNLPQPPTSAAVTQTDTEIPSEQ